MYNFLDDSIYECNNDSFDYDLGDICDNIYTEKTFSLPLKKYVDKIKEIKRAKPSEYEGSNKCKKFIDKYGDDIIKISKLLEKEPEELKSMEIKSVLTMIGSILAVYASIPLFGFEASFIGIAVAVIAIIFAVISLIISVFMIVRVSEATEISNELTKIETTLRKINPKTLPKSIQKKYYDILESIDDAQTAFSSRLKILKESVITDIIFEKYNEGKLSDDKMILLLEASNTNKEEIKRIKEKIKKKEKLTEAEKKKYEMYKKSRNEKIGIGVGAVAAGIATVAAANHIANKSVENDIKRQVDNANKELDERNKAELNAIDEHPDLYTKHGGIDSKIMDQESYIETLERLNARDNKQLEELSKNKFKNRNTIRKIQDAYNNRIQRLEKAKAQITELKKRKIKYQNM